MPAYQLHYQCLPRRVHPHSVSTLAHTPFVEQGMKSDEEIATYFFTALTITLPM